MFLLIFCLNFNPIELSWKRHKVAWITERTSYKKYHVLCFAIDTEVHTITNKWKRCYEVYQLIDYHNHKVNCMMRNDSELSNFSSTITKITIDKNSETQIYLLFIAFAWSSWVDFFSVFIHSWIIDSVFCNAKSWNNLKKEKNSEERPCCGANCVLVFYLCFEVKNELNVNVPEKPEFLEFIEMKST